VVAVETPRLVLRRWRADDAGPLAAIDADPDVMRWIGDGSIRSIDQVRASVDAFERHWNNNGWGVFAVQVRATGELAGLVGLAVPHFLPEVMPAVEIAWRLGQSWWNQGLATEAAQAALEFGLVSCGLDRIIAIVQVGNGASERVMHKLGMHQERQTIDPATGRALRVYEITQSAVHDLA
jgi:RimJ/RimL family protein N-acetyltransferase